MKIKWTSPAIASLKAIEDYISLDSEYYARLVTEKIIRHIDKIEDFPEVGRVVAEYGREDVREVVTMNYRIVYHLHSDSVVILNIIHSSRDFLKGMEDDSG